MSKKHELIFGQDARIDHGYNERLDKYFIQITSNETDKNTIIYLDKDVFVFFAHSMIDSITDQDNPSSHPNGERKDLE